MLYALMTTLVALGLAVSAQASDIEGLDAYRRAAVAGEVGKVSGRAYSEPRRRGEAERTLAGTTVSIVPRSEAFLARLAGVRETARTDERAQATSAGRLKAVQDRYEAGVWAAGGDDLVRVTRVDERGRFTVDDLPAGQWILVAQHAVFVERTSRSGKKKEQGTFTLQPRLLGFYTIDFWVREIAVSAWHETTVELTDRSVWFTGIEEKRRDAGR